MGSTIKAKVNQHQHISTVYKTTITYLSISIRQKYIVFLTTTKSQRILYKISNTICNLCTHRVILRNYINIRLSITLMVNSMSLGLLGSIILVEQIMPMLHFNCSILLLLLDSFSYWHLSLRILCLISLVLCWKSYGIHSSSKDVYVRMRLCSNLLTGRIKCSELERKAILLISGFG